ncbi:MAG: AMP-binding protein [Pseudomonadota bacterium]
MVMANSNEASRHDGFDGLTQPIKKAASTKADKIAILSSEQNRSWIEFQDRVARLAGGFKQIGLKQGERVAILAMNSSTYTELLYAVWWAGGIVVPINIRWSPKEILHSVVDCEAAFLCVDKAFAGLSDTLKPQAASLRHIMHMDDGGGIDALRIETLITSASPIEDRARSGEDIAGIYYTGGTTGVSKGVVISHQAQVHTARAIKVATGMADDAVYLHAAPMFHAGDSAGGGGAAMAGATNAYIPSFTPEGFIAAAKEYQVTHTMLVPTMIGMLLDSPDFDLEALASFQAILYGASPMPEGIIRKCLERWPTVSLIQGYGQTESLPITILPHKYHCFEGEFAGRTRSAGVPALDCSVKIVDEKGENLAPGEIGEIAVQSPANMTEYWKQVELTSLAVQDGWIHTGDGGYIDDDGFVFIVDRIKDMIVTGAENVYSAEVENAISTHPAVAQVAVIGIPSDQWGESVHAIIVTQPSQTCSEEEIIAHCRESIAGYKTPRSVEFRTEALPISGAGKIMKRELREPFWSEKGRSIS